MKRSHVLFILSLIVVCACSKEMDINKTNTQSKNVPSIEELTRSSKIAFNAEGPDINDVKSYLKHFRNIDDDRIQSIRKLDLSDSVYVYLVNMTNDSGWLLVSGDYYSNPVIAHSEEGNIDLLSKDNSNSVVRGWLDGVSNSILENRKNPDSRAVIDNQRKWKVAKLLSKQDNRNTHKGPGIDTSMHYYEYTLDTLVNQLYPALTVTNWYQWDPFNSAVPRYNSNERCFTGCVPVALAQFLYYTHFAYGVPAQMYSYAVCDSYYNNPPYSYDFYNFSASSWNDMALNAGDTILHSTQPVAALIAFMSYITLTNYVNEGTHGEGSTLSFFIPYALAMMGINNAVCANYSKSNIMTEISNGRPVIGEGFSSSDATTGHCFLYDGYYRLSIRETESIYDSNGFLVGENYYYYEDFEWHINSGSAESGFILCFWTSENSYYPYQRSIYTGWTYSNN